MSDHWGLRLGARYRFEWIDWEHSFNDAGDIDGGGETILMEHEGVLTAMDEHAVTFTLDDGNTVYLSREYYPQLHEAVELAPPPSGATLPG